MKESKNPVRAASMYTDWYRVLSRNGTVLMAYLACFVGLYFYLPNIVVPARQFDTQLFISRILLSLLSIHWMFLVWRHWPLFKQIIQAYFNEPASPYNLALFRIIFFFSLWGHLAFSIPDHFQALAQFSADPRVGMPFISWFIEHIPISPELFQGSTIVAAICCFGIVIGWYTRPLMLLLIPLLIYVLGVPNFFGKLSHDHILVWIPIIMVFSPCDKVWSVKALLERLRGNKKQDFDHPAYGWAFRFLWLILGIIYFFAGAYKLYYSGLGWALSSNPVNMLWLEWWENYQQIPFIRIDKVPYLCQLMALGVIFFEMTYLLLILTPATRFWAALGGLSFHQLNAYFLNIGFHKLVLAHFSYFDWHRLIRRHWINEADRRKRFIALVVGAIVSFFFTIGAYVIFLLAKLGATILQGFIPSWKMRVLRRWRTKLGVEKKKAEPETLIPERRNPAFWMASTLLVSSIFLCGLFNIHTWPVSAYPTYHVLREDSFRYIWFKPETQEGTVIDLDELAQEKNFNKEDITPFGEFAQFSLESGDTVLYQKQVVLYWKAWERAIPELQTVVSIPVFLVTQRLAPEHWSSSEQKNIGVIRKEGENWVFLIK